jgi:hypothetical protein
MAVLEVTTQSRLKKGAKIRVIMNTRQTVDLVSRVWEGTINNTTHWTVQDMRAGLCSQNKVGALRSVSMHGSPYVGSSYYCLKCGQYIERDSARVYGYGPGCAGVLGLDIENDTSDEIVQACISAVQAMFSRDLTIDVQGADIEVLEDAPLPQEQPKPEWDARFWIENSKIVVATTPEFRMVMRSVPGWYWDTTCNVWTYPATPSIAVKLRDIFQNYKRVGTKQFVELLKNGENRAEAQNLKTREDLPEISHIKGGGWAHQRAGFAYMCQILTGKNPYESE